jgi:GTP cyclohydrolase IB
MITPCKPENLSDSCKPVLLDVQGLVDTRGIALQNAGIKNVMMPMQIVQKNAAKQWVQACVSISVGLSAEEKGTHMSRFVTQLSQWQQRPVFSLALSDFLRETRQRLSSQSAYIAIAFQYFIDKASPVSQLSSPMAYSCVLKASIDSNDLCQTVLSLAVPCATLCPCSKAISDYGAHNQRAEIRADLLLDSTENHHEIWIEDLVEGLENASSCPVYPLIKRVDEKFITEKAYDNPKFVEDVARDAILFIRHCDAVTGFQLEVEAFESIHAHNAWARHTENFITNLSC